MLLPELVVRHWWENILHNQRAQVLKLILLLRGNQRIIVVNIPWYLKSLEAHTSASMANGFILLQGL